MRELSSTRRLRLATKSFARRRAAGESARGFAQRLFRKHGHGRSWTSGVTLTWLKTRGGERRTSFVTNARAVYTMYQTWLNLNFNFDLKRSTHFDLRRSRATAQKTSLAQTLGLLPRRETQASSVAAPGSDPRRFHTLVQKLNFTRAQTSWSRLFAAANWGRIEYWKSSTGSRTSLLQSVAKDSLRQQGFLSATAAQNFNKSLRPTSNQRELENTKPGFAHTGQSFFHALPETEWLPQILAARDKFTPWLTTSLQNSFTRFSSHTFGANRGGTNAGLSSNASNRGAEKTSARVFHPVRPMQQREPGGMSAAHRFAFAPEMVLAQPKMKATESRDDIAPSASAPAMMAATNGASYSAKTPPAFAPAPEIDIARLTERVYSELERKMKNERVRRGL
jgi:hypothetical protein